MDPYEDNPLRFCRFIRSFQCERVPCDLIIRACQPKSTWSSSGEVVERLPLEAGVPQWLIDIYNENRLLFHDPDHGAYLGGIEIIIENCVPYFQVATANQSESDLCQLSAIADERSMAQERISVFLQAFPSINIEVIGEEIVDLLMDVATRSILPLLSCVTDADIKEWLLPKTHGDLESYVFPLFEFIYQVIAILGNELPPLSLSLPERILNIVPQGMGHDSMVALQRIADILKQFKDNGQDVLEFKHLSSGKKADKRSHAIVGYFLSLHNIHFAKALTTWQPLCPKSPSQMEYLAAISFCDQPRLALLGRPAFLTLDTRVLEGLLRSRRKQHNQAAKSLEATRDEVVCQYGPCSMQVGIVTAELANCYNILRQEVMAEFTITKSLKLRLDSKLSNRRDGIYLMLTLVDSFIGQAKYQEAVPVLERVMGDPNIPATFRMISALRLARSRRRMHEDSRNAFEQKGPLWTGLALLGIVPDVLVMEYVEELGCSISELPKSGLEDSKNTQELIEAVNSALRTSSSVINKPCWEWYTECQQEYSGQIKKALKKGKGVADVLQTEDPKAIGAPISPRPRASSCPPPQAVIDMSADEGPWSERLVLSFDDGGVRAFSSLLILKRIMQEIEMLESTHPDGPAYSSSDSSWSPRHRSDPLRVPGESDSIERFFPCHYFDYVAGASTGGLNSIMLGRLRMSVGQAIDSFITFGNAVFGRPRLFHSTSRYFPSRTKYPAANVRRAFQNIIAKKLDVLYYSEWLSSGGRASFQESSGGIRTMVFSYRYSKRNGGETHIWRSYDDKEHARIWEVACATSVSPGYFDAVEINGARYLGGYWVVDNLSYTAVAEVLVTHEKAPVVVVNIGTGTKDSPNVTLGRDTKRHDYFGDIFKTSSILKSALTGKEETNQWMEFVGTLGIENAYRLGADEKLQAIPYDDWRPATTGKHTMKKITDITNEYLDKDEITGAIRLIAKKAVQIRRARARTERWKSFVEDPNAPSRNGSVF